MAELFTARLGGEDRAQSSRTEEIRIPSEGLLGMEARENARRESRLGKAGVSLGMITTLALAVMGIGYIAQDPQGASDGLGITEKMEKVVEIAKELRDVIDH